MTWEHHHSTIGKLEMAFKSDKKKKKNQLTMVNLDTIALHGFCRTWKGSKVLTFLCSRAKEKKLKGFTCTLAVNFVISIENWNKAEQKIANASLKWETATPSYDEWWWRFIRTERFIESEAAKQKHSTSLYINEHLEVLYRCISMRFMLYMRYIRCDLNMYERIFTNIEHTNWEWILLSTVESTRNILDSLASFDTLIFSNMKWRNSENSFISYFMVNLC